MSQTHTHVRASGPSGPLGSRGPWWATPGSTGRCAVPRQPRPIGRKQVGGLLLPLAVPVHLPSTSPAQPENFKFKLNFKLNFKLQLEVTPIQLELEVAPNLF